MVQRISFHLPEKTSIRMSISFQRIIESIASLVQKFWVGSQREAAAMFKRNGVYFIVTSGATGWTPNQMKYGHGNQHCRNMERTQ